MKRVYSRVTHHHSVRDFEQERANLREGYENLLNTYREMANDISSNSSLSPEEARTQLQACRDAIINANEEYLENLRQLDIEQAQQIEGEEHSGGEDYCDFEQSSQEENGRAEEYCNFSQQAQTAYNAEQYCQFENESGYSSAQEGYSADNGMSADSAGVQSSYGTDGYEAE